MKRLEWFVFRAGFLVFAGLIVFDFPTLTERTYLIPILRLMSSIVILFIGACMAKQRYWSGYADGSREIKVTAEREVEKAMRHLRQENKDLQDTIFTYEAVIWELEINAGCYDGEDGE